MNHNYVYFSRRIESLLCHCGGLQAIRVHVWGEQDVPVCEILLSRRKTREMHRRWMGNCFKTSTVGLMNMITVLQVWIRDASTTSIALKVPFVRIRNSVNVRRSLLPVWMAANVTVSFYFLMKTSFFLCKYVLGSSKTNIPSFVTFTIVLLITFTYFRTSTFFYNVVY